MPVRKIFIYLLFLLYLLISPSVAQDLPERMFPDVISYKLHLEPDIQEKSLRGKVIIHFLANEKQELVAFNCGDLNVDSVNGKTVESFRAENHQLLIRLSGSEKNEHIVEISYHGKPSKGINFFPEISQVYTVFHTGEWMICNESLNDKASVTLNIKVSDSLTLIANGELKDKKESGGHQLIYTYHHESPIPAYTFGFAAGKFNSSEDTAAGVSLKYYAHNYTSEALDTIFRETASMLRFFEEKSGVPFEGSSYSQILGQGWVSQEMGGFAVIRNNYGKQVLADETQINLSAHELAHQWWGNQITCKDWNHFWLNEGFAVFMSSAYKEHRFGRDAYLEDIKLYFDAYKKVKDKGLDKPLVFQNRTDPTADDRALVYYKGAWVLHLLKEELGNEIFWKGIKHYTQKHYGKSVVSKDFKEAMEESANVELDDFFHEWVY